MNSGLESINSIDSINITSDKNSNKLTVESILKELKGNLTKYETVLQKLENLDVVQNNKKTKLNDLDFENLVSPNLNEIEKIKLLIDKNSQSLSIIITKEDHKFIFNKYKELKEQLNQRCKNIQKNISRKNENKKLEYLLLNSNSNNPNQSAIGILNEENQSLNTCLQISDDLRRIAMTSEVELGSQEKSLKNNRNRLEVLLSKIPQLNKVLSSIKFHKYKERIILGIVIGAILYLGLYLTFY